MWNFFDQNLGNMVMMKGEMVVMGSGDCGGVFGVDSSAG